jgi:hypothetical protein
MAARVHRPLTVVAFNANGIGRQAHELRKQMQDQKIDVLFSETHLKPHMRFYIPNVLTLMVSHLCSLELGKATPPQIFMGCTSNPYFSFSAYDS